MWPTSQNHTLNKPLSAHDMRKHPAAVYTDHMTLDKIVQKNEENII